MSDDPGIWPLVAFSAVGIAFGAFCLWLSIRVINRRERWAKRTAATIVALSVMLVAYVLSIGPAAWLVSHGHISDLAFEQFYRPIEYFEGIVVQNLPRRAAISFALASHRAFKWYLGLWVP